MKRLNFTVTDGEIYIIDQNTTVRIIPTLGPVTIR